MLKLLLILTSTLFTLTTAQSFYPYKTVNNISIELAVWVPNITLSTKYPVVLAIHGGGYLVGGCTGGELSGQELTEMLERGWVVVSADYRLAPYNYLPDMVQDLQDAYDWIRNELVNMVNIDPNAIAVWGNSAGGGLSVLCGYKLSPPPVAVIAFYPYCTNWTDAYAYNSTAPVSQDLIDSANSVKYFLTEYNALPSNDPRWNLFYLAQAEQKAGWLFTTDDPNASPDSILAELKNYSVVENIDANYPPTFLIHGLADVIVPYSQSQEMAAQLENFNVTYQLELVPGVGHAFDMGGLNQQMWNEYIVPVFDFTQQYLTKAATPVTEISI